MSMHKLGLACVMCLSVTVLILPTTPGLVAQDGNKPVTIPVPALQLQAPWSLKPTPPTLSSGQATNVGVWGEHLRVNNNIEAMYLLPKVNAWLTHPANDGFRPKDAAETLQVIHGAMRALRYELNPNGADPLSNQLLGGFKLSDLGLPPSGEIAVDKIKGAVGEKFDKFLTKKLPAYGRWNPLLSVVGIMDQAAGERVARDAYEFEDKKYLQILNQAYRRANREEPLSVRRGAADTDLIVGAAKELRAAADRGNPIVKAVLGDTSKHGLDPVPLKPHDELKNDPRYALAVQALDIAAKILPGAPREAPAPAGAGLSPKDARAIQLLTRELQQHRAALDRNTKELKALQKALAGTPSKTQEQQKAKDQLCQERLQLIREVGQGVHLALGCLRALGVDAGTVRDLGIVANAGLQVAAGVTMAIANVYNPVGWITILGGIASLFSTGPDMNQLILEQLAAIRRDLADFRYEMRVTLAQLREEQRLFANKMIERVNDMEYHLAAKLDRNLEQSRWNEYRLNQIEGTIQAMSQQILTRLAELHQKDIVTLLSSRDLDRGQFVGLNSPTPPSELLRTRYHDALTTAYASSVHHAATRTLAGGDFQISSSYGTVDPTLVTGSPHRLLPVVQDPASPWARVNDLITMAQSAGVRAISESGPPAPRRADDPLEAGLLLTTRAAELRYPPDRSRVVNPMAWQLAAGVYLDLAVEGGKYFQDRPDYCRGLAEVYRRGEEFNDAVNTLAGGPDGGVFGRLTTLQLKAIEELEKEMTNNAEKIHKQLGTDPWKKLETQSPPNGKYVQWEGPAKDWQDRLINQQYQTQGYGPDDFKFENAACQRLTDGGYIHKTYVMASRVIPAEGRGGTQAYFGGSFDLRITDVDLGQDHIKEANARRQSTGTFGWGPGKYHPFLLYDGPMYVTVEVKYRTTGNPLGYSVFRKRLPTREHARFRREQDADDAKKVTFTSYTPDEFNTVLGAYSKLKTFADPDPYKHYKPEEGVFPAIPPVGGKGGFALTDFLKSQWAGLAEDIFRTEVGQLASPDVTVEAVEKALTDRFQYEVFEFERDADGAVTQGLRRAGELIREVVGCQGLMLRYAQLALPESMTDAELLALLVGDQAAWGGTVVMERFKVSDRANQVKPVEKVGDKYEVHLTKTMRTQTLKLQAKFAELLGRRRAGAEPFRHPAVEGMLTRIVLASKGMKIDLERELKAGGAVVPPHWVVSRINGWTDQLEGKGEGR